MQAHASAMAAPRVAVVCCLAELSELARTGASTPLPCAPSSAPTTGTPSTSNQPVPPVPPALSLSGRRGFSIDKFQNAPGAARPAAGDGVGASEPVGTDLVRDLLRARRLQGSHSGGGARAVAQSDAARPVPERHAFQGLNGNVSTSAGAEFPGGRTSSTAWEAGELQRSDTAGGAGVEGASSSGRAEGDEADVAAGTLAPPLVSPFMCRSEAWGFLASAVVSALRSGCVSIFNGTLHMVCF